MEEEGGLESRPLHEAEGPLTPVCDHDANTPGATCCLGWLHICGLSCFSYVSWEGGIIIPAFSREENEGSAREWLSQGHALLRPASVSLQVKCPF